MCCGVSGELCDSLAGPRRRRRCSMFVEGGVRSEETKQVNKLGFCIVQLGWGGSTGNAGRERCHKTQPSPPLTMTTVRHFQQQARRHNDTTITTCLLL